MILTFILEPLKLFYCSALLNNIVANTFDYLSQWTRDCMTAFRCPRHSQAGAPHPITELQGLLIDKGTLRMVLTFALGQSLSMMPSPQWVGFSKHSCQHRRG